MCSVSLFVFWSSTLLVSEIYRYVNKLAYWIFFLHFTLFRFFVRPLQFNQWNWETIASFFSPSGACFDFSHLVDAYNWQNGKIHFVDHFFWWNVFLVFDICRTNCSNKLELKSWPHRIQDEIHLIPFPCCQKNIIFACFLSLSLSLYILSNKYGFGFI